MRFLLCFALVAAICTAHAQTRTGRDYAVFFYTTNFQKGWQNLPETASESLLLKKELETNYQFECEVVPNPSKQQMRDKIREYNKKAKANDQVLFFFSMHGYYKPESDRGYLIGSDGKLDDTYADTWLSYDDIREDLAPCKAKHILLALDACHSGSFGIRNKSKPEHAAFEETADCSAQINKTMRYTGRQYCSSGNKNTKTPAKSLFAARFLEALRRGGPEGILHFDDLEYWLGKIDAPEPETGSFTGHEPSGDFVFVMKNACASSTGGAKETVEDQIWNTALAKNTADAYDMYLTMHPQGKYAETARTKKEHVSKSKTIPNVAPSNNRPINTPTTPPEDPLGLVWVAGGTFTMGSPETEADRSIDETQHQVTLDGYYIGKYEVTQKLWTDIMGSNPSQFKDCEQCPVEQVSWDDAQAFLVKLNARYPGKNYRLPTEAEWEYAALGRGKAVLFGNGKNVIDPKEINFDASKGYKKPYSVVGEYRQKTVPVGSLNSPNALGLHDMSGNVWEWCSDWYGTYATGSESNPKGAKTGSNRVLRGGSWLNYPQNCRVANRFDYSPGYRDYLIGFRLARTN